MSIYEQNYGSAALLAIVEVLGLETRHRQAKSPLISHIQRIFTTELCNYAKCKGLFSAFQMNVDGVPVNCHLLTNVKEIQYDCAWVGYHGGFSQISPPPLSAHLLCQTSKSIPPPHSLEASQNETF